MFRVLILWSCDHHISLVACWGAGISCIFQWQRVQGREAVWISGLGNLNQQLHYKNQEYLGGQGNHHFHLLRCLWSPLHALVMCKVTRVHVSSPKNLVKEYMSTVECFVIASCSFCVGRIRSWYWFSEHGVVVYNIMGNRFCERIGRQHKSNNGEHMYSVSWSFHSTRKTLWRCWSQWYWWYPGHFFKTLFLLLTANKSVCCGWDVSSTVMYIVDFRTAGFYQKCHDPDCRGNAG